MSGTYPTSPVFNSVNFTSEFFNLSSQTISGRTQVRNIGGQRFTFTASYPRLSRSEFSPVQGFLMAQRGMAETFTMVLPEVSSSSGSVSGTMLSSAAGSIGDTSIAVDGFTGMGARAGGIDGKGGFPAILHPNETVVDHTKGQGMATNVNITIQANDTKGFDELLYKRRGQLVNIINQAINNRGRASLA